MRRAPDGGEDLSVRYDASGVLCQERKKFELLRRQLEFGAGAAGAMADSVNFQITDAQHRDFSLALHAMPQRRAHTRQQLANIERLIDVIVGAEVERLDLFSLALTRRQH